MLDKIEYILILLIVTTWNPKAEKLAQMMFLSLNIMLIGRKFIGDWQFIVAIYLFDDSLIYHKGKISEVGDKQDYQNIIIQAHESKHVFYLPYVIQYNLKDVLFFKDIILI
ncbi:hypothetical protein ACJX0J_037733 [Zea mays]